MTDFEAFKRNLLPPNGRPVGGGRGYPQGGFSEIAVVKSREDLLGALARAQGGQAVRVWEASEIDLTGVRDIVIPPGVTLFSRRGLVHPVRPGAWLEGGLLTTTQLDTRPLLRAGGLGVRLWGLRIRGPDGETREEELRPLLARGSAAYYSVPVSVGVGVGRGANALIENCELWDWSHAAVMLWPGALPSTVRQSTIRRCRRWGLGYGVGLNQAHGIIDANVFDQCRHCVSGTGMPGTSYMAYYNRVTADQESYNFEMHGGANRGDGGPAGDEILIQGNAFEGTQQVSVAIRGRPTVGAWIRWNWFADPVPAHAACQFYVSGLSTADRNFIVTGNRYGPEGKIADPGPKDG